MLKQSWGVDRPGPVPSPMSIGKVLSATIEGCCSRMAELRLPTVACLALCMDIKEGGREDACQASTSLGLSGCLLHPQKRASSCVAVS